MDVNQKNRPPGVLQEYENATIWVKTWSQILAECEGRLKFFQDELKYRADRDSALKYLHNGFNQFMPEVFREPEPGNGEEE